MKKIIFIISVLLVLLIVTGYLLKKYKAKSGNENSSEAETNPFPLKLGSQGPEVQTVQRFLNKPSQLGPGLDELEFATSLPETGIYDERTDATIRLFLNKTEIDENYYNEVILS